MTDLIINQKSSSDFRVSQFPVEYYIELHVVISDNQNINIYDKEVTVPFPLGKWEFTL